MARLTFMEFANAPMANVKTNINKVALVKPIEVANTNTSNPTFASTSFIDAGSTAVKLVAIGVSDFNTYTVEPSKFIQPGQDAVINDLTVNGNTILGDANTDTISLVGKVIGTVSGPSATISVQTVSATTVSAGTVSATTVSAITVNAANLSINGVAYKPFYASTSTPAASYQDRLWINTAATVPYLQYYNGSTWVSIGAVFG